MALDRFRYTWENPEELGCAIDYWPGRTSYAQFKKMGEEIIVEFHEKTRLKERTVIATEHAFAVPMGDHVISGVVDLMELTHDKNGFPVLSIKDFKTNSRKPTRVQLEFDTQFTLYYYASLQPEFWTGAEEIDPKYKPIEDGLEWFELFNEPESSRKLVWWHLRTRQEIDCGPRDDSDFLRMYRLMMSIANAVEKGVFVPSINADSCNWCPFTEECIAIGPELMHKITEQRYNPRPVPIENASRPKLEYGGNRWLDG